MTMYGITNIGCLVSGDINQPLLNADTIIIKDKYIADIGNSDILKNYQLDQILDVDGMTVTPGLIDSHAHVFMGDYTPRQNAIGFIEKCLNGGVTTMISAGESHAPGRPKDPQGTKALAILAHKSFENNRPAGVKVHGGAVILEKGMTEEDFIELAEAGVWLVGEIGLGTVKEPVEAAQMVKWAKKHGFITMLHTGGTSVPGSTSITAADVLTICPDVVSHINGGPTAISLEEIDKIIASDEDFALELVQCGNYKALVHSVKKAKEMGKLDKIILGNDSPSGSGVVTLGILRNISFIASFCDVSPEVAIAMATGNTARRFNLNTGIIGKNKEADLVIMDAPPGSSGSTALEALAAGDLPGIAYVIVDGEIKVRKSTTTPPSNRKVIVR
ncbi:Enamidase [Thermoanaerobacteraceae bacterium SP2]|nr:Enamidase [Thermoanaerobacteraceae bacterium SP2]